MVSHSNRHYLHYCVYEDLTSVQDWFNANKLTLNLKKTAYLLFEKEFSKNTDLDLSLNGVTIPRLRHTKFLGLWVDDELTWKEHAERLLMRLNSRLGLLLCGKNMLSQHAKKLLYFGQMHSLIVYGLSIWGTLVSQSYLNEIQQIQDKCLRAIAPKLSASECRKKHCILKIRDQVDLEQAKLGYKACKALLPTKFSNNILTDSAEISLLQGLSVLFACVGSSDPVRVLHLYTMNTLDIL